MKIRAQVIGEWNLFLGAIESDWELHGTCITFLKKEGHKMDGKQHLKGLGYLGSWKGRATNH